MSDISRQNIMNEVFGDRASTALMAFVWTARAGSFAKAAELMGVTPSGVAKAVQRLESRLGSVLFARTTRRLSLTETGALLLGHAEHILDAVTAAETSLAQVAGRPRGRLKISLAPGIGRALVLPTLGAFMQSYPEIRLDVELDSRQVDVIAGGFDVVLRTGDALTDSSLRGRRLGRERTMLCAAPGYLGRKGTPNSATALAYHDCIRYRVPTSGRVQSWPLPSGSHPEVPQSIVFNDPDAVRLSALAGLGIAALAGYAARPAFAAGTLVPVLQDLWALQPESESWLLWPPDRQHLPKLRVFVDHLVAVFQAHCPDAEYRHRNTR